MKKPKKTKPKIGLWARIKNIYDNSPWHAAFSYPFVFLFLYIVFIILIENLAEYLGFNNLFVSIYFGFIIFLIPLWVLVGLIVSRRRFPYLLALIFGLGIFILPYLAYEGYANSAKTNATKTMHAQTVKYISAEIQKCKIGESKFMSNSQDCPATALKVINGAAATMADVNPFESEKLSIRLSNSNTTDEDVGYVSLSASGSNIIIKTCNKTPCRKEENRLQASIGIE